MSFVYALVARDQQVLCEYMADTSGNFTTITRAVLSHLSSLTASSSVQTSGSTSEATEADTANTTSTKSVLPYNDHNFFFLRDQLLTFMCMAQAKVHANVAFKLLGECSQLFYHKFTLKQAQMAIAYAMNTLFQHELQALFKKYDHLVLETPLTQLRHKMENVKTIMIENVHQLMERGEKIDLLVERTEKLQQGAFKYQKETTKLKNSMWWQNIKYLFLLVIVTSLVVLILLVLTCGFDFSSCASRVEHKAESTVQDRYDRLSKGVVDTTNGIVDKARGAAPPPQGFVGAAA